LAVRFLADRIAVDSQEWLSYKNRLIQCPARPGLTRWAETSRLNLYTES